MNISSYQRNKVQLTISCANITRFTKQVITCTLVSTEAGQLQSLTRAKGMNCFRITIAWWRQYLLTHSESTLPENITLHAESLLTHRAFNHNNSELAETKTYCSAAKQLDGFKRKNDRCTMATHIGISNKPISKSMLFQLKSCGLPFTDVILIFLLVSYPANNIKYRVN